MAKKQLSFAEKAAKKKGKGLKSVKFIKSILSEKSGHWRFKEKMIHLLGGESLDDALKRQEDALNALDMKMPVFEDEQDVKQSTDSTDASENAQESTDNTEETKVGKEAVSEEKPTEENMEIMRKLSRFNPVCKKSKTLTKLEKQYENNYRGNWYFC